jgi:hypothetical protein
MLKSFGSTCNPPRCELTMNSTRREFLQRSAAAAAGITLANSIAEAQDPILPPSPAISRNVIFDPDEIPRLQQTVRHPRFAPFWQSMKGADLQADRVFLRDQLKLNNHVRDLLRARQILERSAFVYALTQDRDHLAIAREAIDKILLYTKWDYFLEGGEETIGLQRAPETTIAMVSALEWLDDALTPQMKKEIMRQIGEKGAPACYRTLYGMRYPDRVKGWGFDPESDYTYRFDLRRWPFILNATNLKVIPIAGLALAGCKLYDIEPAAPRWVDLALQSARAFSTMFGSDGSYDEGAGYWGYTCQHLTLCIAALHRRLQIDERHLINFAGTARYALNMSMPVNGRPKECVNFGDAGGLGDTSVAAWTAREHRDRLAQYVALSAGEVSSHLAIVWYDSTVEPQAPDSSMLNTRFANDWVVARTGWSERDTVVALRSGGPGNHEHADRNSVIFAAHGERIFHDHFHAAYSYTDPLWILRFTSAHSAVLLNGKGHQYHDGHEGTNASWAEAQIVRYAAQGNSVVVTSDATQAYRMVTPEAALVRRTLVVLKPDVVLLLDHVRFNKTPGSVQVRFQVDNSDGKGSVSADDKGFVIHRPFASGRGVVDAATPLKIAALTLPVGETKEKEVYPFAEVSCGDAQEHRILTVCTAQKSGVAHGALAVTRDGNILTVKGIHNDQHINVRLNCNADQPEITL